MQLTKERPALPDMPAFLLFFARQRKESDTYAVMTEHEYENAREYEPKFIAATYAEYKEDVAKSNAHIKSCHFMAEAISSTRKKFEKICTTVENRADFVGWIGK